jgi:hypothetical protein
MSESTRYHREDDASDRSLADRLRTTLHAARGNLQIRECLKDIISDPSRFEPIVRELGPRHALVRELLTITQHSEMDAGRPTH